MPETRPPIHALIIGDAGGGKSTVAATFPKPMLVHSFDPLGKEIPYLKVGDMQPVQLPIPGGTPYRDVVSKKSGKLLIRIRYYLDADMTHPDAYRRLLADLAKLQAEYAEWATVVFDSTTFAELAARKWHQYGLNPQAKDPRQWFGGSTDLLEELIMGRVAALPMNAVVIAHVDEEKDELHGMMLRSPKLPGRLRKGAASAFPELYRAFVGKDGDTGERVHLLQTQADAIWNCASQINAPNPCVPYYSALWGGWEG